MAAQKNFASEPSTLFENVALAFSGGGFRASSFALCTLSLYNEINAISASETQKNEPLLRKVRFLGSASGGTIATALYSLYDANGKSFGDFYKKIHVATQGDTLLKKALEILTTDSYWAGPFKKNRNLINAFAQAYDDLLFTDKDAGFEKALLGALKSDNPITHLDEVCFNATEFYHGLLFRQNVNMKS